MELTALIEKHLYDYFEGAENDNALIGIEGEKIGVRRNGRTASYNGKNGYLAVLGRLYEELGWEITKQNGKSIMELSRCRTILALESDGRIELTGSPHHSIHDLAREFYIHQNEIAEISKIFGLSWLGIGYQPISRNKDIALIPKERTRLSTEYMQNKGNSSVAWAKKTASIQVNIDYASQEDFAKKSRVMTKISPVITAMYANSPFSLGKFTGYMSFRNHIALKSDPERFIIPQSLYESEMNYQDWIEFCMDLPMMFLKRGEEWYQPHMTFRQFVSEGYLDFRANIEDWETHLTTIYLPARMKKVIEFRNCDSVPPSLVPSVAALMKGLMYSDDALDSLDTMTKNWSYHEFCDLQHDASKLGLQATIHGKKLSDLAREILALATESLRQERIVDFDGHDESVFLESIKQYVLLYEKSPAEWIIEKWLGEWNKNFYPVLKWCQY